MRKTSSVKFAGALLALAILSACGGSAFAPSSTGLNGAALVPDKSTKAKGYVYLMGSTSTSIFDYPKSDKQIGTIENVTGGACANALYGYGKKTFWIVAGETQIEEFQVLKKPIKTLSESVGAPTGCGMDSRGDLAIGIVYGSGAGDVVVYKNARGSGAVYTTPLAKTYFVGYDNKGNLFADGFAGNYAFALVELPRGSSTFETVTTSNTVGFPGSVQWDGNYLDVTDQLSSSMYQYAVSGTTATLKGTVTLSGAADCGQTWIGAGVVFCADAGNNDAEVFKYPAGGSAIATLGSSYLPLGVTAAAK